MRRLYEKWGTMPSAMAEGGEPEPRQIDRLVDLADGVINDRERWVHHAPVSDSLVKLGLAEVVGSSGSQLYGHKDIVLYRITPRGANLFRNEWWHNLLAAKLDALPHQPASAPKPYPTALIGGLVMLAAIATGVAAGSSLPRFVGEVSSVYTRSAGGSPAATPNDTPMRSAAATKANRCVSTPSISRKCPDRPNQRVI